MGLDVPIPPASNSLSWNGVAQLNQGSRDGGYTAIARPCPCPPPVTRKALPLMLDCCCTFWGASVNSEKLFSVATLPSCPSGGQKPPWRNRSLLQDLEVPSACALTVFSTDGDIVASIPVNYLQLLETSGICSNWEGKANTKIKHRLWAYHLTCDEL